MAIVNELVTKFSYQGSTAPINNYTKSLEGAFVGLAKLTAFAGVAVTGIAMMVAKTADQADALGDLSQRINVSTDSIQQLGYVAQLNGSSFDAMNSSLEGLNRQIGLAASGGKAQEDVFKQLGISIKDNSGAIKTADVVFVEMQARMKALGYGTQQVAGVLRKLRLDPTMAQTLNLTTEEMAKYTKEARDAGLMSKEQIAQAQEFNDNLDRMKFRLMSVVNQLSLGMMPAVSKLMDVLSGAISFMSGFIKIVIQLGTGVYKAIDSTVGFGNAMTALGVIMAIFYRGALLNLILGMRALAVAMFMNPITWIVAGLIGLIVVVEDLYQAFTGGESAIGDFFAQFDIDIVNSMINAVNELMRSVTLVAFPFMGLGLIIAGVAQGMVTLLNLFGANISTKGIDALNKKMQEQTAYMQDVITGDTKVIANRAAYVPSAPTPQGTQGAVANNVTNTVTITGVSDPQKAATLTAAELQKQNRAATTQRGNGGR